MSLIYEKDTICAISTPIGEGGIGIVRLSGDNAIQIVDSIFKPKSKINFLSVPSHTIHYGHIVDNNNTIIDEVLVCLYRAPRSYTTEDIVEINTHGGIVLTRRILDILINKDARLAEPGEFTKRAFLNGRIDLPQAEAVLDIIKAKTDLSAKAALEHLEGQFSSCIDEVRSRLVALCAHIEAYVDFPDEDDISFNNEQLSDEFKRVEETLATMIDTYKNGEILREGVHTVIVGKPNVGKSSLLNTLLNRDRAIVSKIPGTTRDALEELIEIHGILFRLVDTAGIMKTPQHELDYLSVGKTQQHYEKGDLILFVIDGSQALSEADQDIYEKVRKKHCIIVLNKSDLKKCINEKDVRVWCGDDVSIITISIVNKSGIAALEKKNGKLCLEREI
ncbi:MAG: tRNA uridine-5-carboxymethylaminomethyl(34) synthesis GTPase MnmE [Candidatus Omnitrophota bacterium]